MEITEEQLKEILYHLNGNLRLFGYGREYEKIVELVNSLHDKIPNFDWEQFYSIKNVLRK